MKKRFPVYSAFIVCSILFLSLNLWGQQQNGAGDMRVFDQHFKLMPAPQKIILINGKGISPGFCKSILLKGGAVKPPLNGSLALLPLAAKEGAGTVVLNISNKQDLPSSKEGYVLEVNNSRISIEAGSQAGIFYGCQTLQQLLEDAGDQQLTVPACKITDYPDIDYRAIHLDLKHHVDAGKYYYDMIDRLAAVKINAIIVEFEDKLRYRKSAVVGSGNAISVDEFAALSRYAKDRNIEISPLVQGLGHAAFILKHDEYKKLRDTISSDWSFDPMNPETYDLQFSLYEDAIAATPYGKYLHVGGDEVGHLGMSELSKKSGLTAIQLQMQWLNKVSEFAIKHNRIPIFWDDMVFKLSDLYQTTWDPEVKAQDVTAAWASNKHKLEENVSLFPTECIYMRWNYDAPDIPGNRLALDWYKSHHLKVMAATAAQTMWPMMPRQHSNFKAIKDFSRITAEKKLDGILCTAWDDCSPHFETYWRGFYDFGFFSWHYVDVKADDLHSTFRHRFFAPTLSAPAFDVEDQLETALPFWETALIDKGTRENYPSKIELIGLPDPQKKNAWAATYQSKIEHADKEVIRYESIKKTIIQSLSLARRNEYSLEIFQQINELQVYASKLLILLDKYDKTATAPEQQAAKDAIKKQVESFESLRKNYESVFSKTRLLANPANYVLDQNQHEHLANGTNNSDWMFVYELAMNKKIVEWLGN